MKHIHVPIHISIQLFILLDHCVEQPEINAHITVYPRINLKMDENSRSRSPTRMAIQIDDIIHGHTISPGKRKIRCESQLPITPARKSRSTTAQPADIPTSKYAEAEIHTPMPNSTISIGTNKHNMNFSSRNEPQSSQPSQPSQQEISTMAINIPVPDDDMDDDLEAGNQEEEEGKLDEERQEWHGWHDFTKDNNDTAENPERDRSQWKGWFDFNKKDHHSNTKEFHIFINRSANIEYPQGYFWVWCDNTSRYWTWQNHQWWTAFYILHECKTQHEIHWYTAKQWASWTSWTNSTEDMDAA